MRKLTTVLLGSAAAITLVAGPAFAYTGTPLTDGHGFVGKGEVQQPWGWNNAALQKNAGGVSFSVESDVEYTAVCGWDTGQPGSRGAKHHTVNRHRSTSVDKVVMHEIRNNPKSAVTGFNLIGFGAVTETGDALPVVGESCLGEGTNGTWESVTETGGSPAGLFAHHLTKSSIQLVDTNPTPTA